ncbi:PREDICTED: uncharacterized protein LOC109363241 isoform X3 [Lupinus angustifolius]|uniref:uncharacterized protein LOC109363241 isoform X3 n=1 Tax=Lupinus angustifolius TaxID=3871 RepID=UPI00092E4AC1|nr:PREDICTED: uncharacterized protein LOC109363241 isoform X3 [Lupinus angustifolius]
MDLKFNHINWVGNICQKFEAVCQEVDNVVSKNAVKYLESQVQNVGGSVQKIYSGVVQDVLPLTPLVNSAKYLETQVQSVGDNVHKVYSGVVQQLLPHPPFVNSAKHEACSVAPENEIDSPVKSFAAVEDDNEKGDELTPPNNFIESLADSNAFNLANDQHAGSPIEHDLVNQVSDETCSDSYITQEEVVGDDHSIETSVDKRENMDVTIKEIAVESASQPKNSISVKEKEALEFSICSESYSGCSGSGCEVLIEKKDNLDMNLEPNSCSIVEINATNSYSSPVLNFMSPSEKESIKASLSSDLSDVADEDTHGILAEVSTAASAVPCGRPITETEPLCFKSSACSETLYSKSLGSYSYEIESYKNNSDESLVKSMESILDDIQLNDDTKLEESCVFVDDSELHAVSCRTQKLRSYKKRIQDAFSLKKRLVKEYEQLAIWYGDTDLEHSQGLSRTLLPFRSRTYEDSKNLQGHDASETEWELL